MIGFADPNLATTETTPMNVPSISFDILDATANQLLKDGYSFFMFVQPSQYTEDVVRVTLEKRSHADGMCLKVDAHGPTPALAFERALRNFPERPLDGVTEWAELPQLEAPDAISEGN